MNTAPKLTRSVLIAIAAIATMAALAFASEMTFRTAVLRFHPEGATLAAHFSWVINQWLYMFPALIVGICTARLARCRPSTYLIAMLCIQGMLIGRDWLFAPTHPIPSWLWIQTLLLTPIPIILVGWLQMRGPSNAGTTGDGIPAALGDGG